MLPQTLQAKFLSGLALALACLVGFFAFALNLHLGQLMEREAREKASLILSQVGAVQGYVRITLRPAMYRLLPENQFALEAMSTSYITRFIMSDLNLAKEAFTYRRVGIGARNPDYEARPLERALIRRFEADPKLVHVEEFVQLDGERHYITAQPQRFEAACLHCHGDPDKAPRELIERYGDKRGFGRRVGQLAGIDMVSLKVERDVGGIRDATASFALLFAGGILVMFLGIQGFFHRLVVVSLRRVTGVMQRLFPEEAQAVAPGARPSPGGPAGLAVAAGAGGKTEPPVPATVHGHDDEIEKLLHGFEVFAEHLRHAREDLKDYAATLEDKVAERTVDLKRLADERRADVSLFVSLLNGLNESQNKRQLLFTSLELIARRFGAARAAYACVLSGSDYAAWPDPEARPELPADWHELVSGAGQEEDAGLAPRLAPLAWYIPVQTSGTSRGLLCLYWDEPQEGSGRLAELARAIGQQMGIAMENLDALDNLLRQNAMLSSIIEGIADPLMLVDARGSLLLANASAQQLAAEAAHGLTPLLEAATAGSGHGELVLPGSGADERIFEASLYPLSGQEEGREAGRGGPQRFVTYLREVTAQRRMEGQMRQSERLVAVGQLAAGLAHEINNPLGVIQCYAELLHAAEERPQAQADLDIIMRHTEQARKVVRDLLDFARPCAATPGPTDLAAQAATMVEVLGPRARALGASLSLHAEPGLPLVRAGADALEHVLSNILLNALDAVAENPQGHERRVEVSLRREDGSVILAVADTGPGIAPKHLDRVFDPFFTTKGVGKGTGLGLAVVYGLVHELGGQLGAANRDPGVPGGAGGAVFTVRLPAAPAKHVTPGEVEPGREPSTLAVPGPVESPPPGAATPEPGQPEPGQAEAAEAKPRQAQSRQDERTQEQPRSGEEKP
ncbi:c-type heme family protein [Humidesulfovibrio sp.]